MTSDQTANRTTGETEGVEQEPTEAGEHDATQREQAAREGQPGTAAAGTPTEQKNEENR